MSLDGHAHDPWKQQRSSRRDFATCHSASQQPEDAEGVEGKTPSGAEPLPKSRQSNAATIAAITMKQHQYPVGDRRARFADWLPHGSCVGARRLVPHGPPPPCSPRSCWSHAKQTVDPRTCPIPTRSGISTSPPSSVFVFFYACL